MAVTLTSTLKVNFTASLVNAGTRITATAPVAHSYTLSLASGTIINTADKIFHDDRTVTAASPDSIDLAGALTDPLGATVTFAKIIGIIIENSSTTAAEILEVGGNAAPFSTWLGAASDTIKIGPGGCFVLFNPSLAGYAVTGTTADILDIDVASGTNVPYIITVVGRSA
jgi:hypothetical protein